MLNRLSTSYHPFEFLAGRLEELLPGIERVKIFYFDERSFEVKVIVYQQGDWETESVEEDDLPKVQRQRALSQRHEWCKPSYELHQLHGESRPTVQLSLSDEAQSNLLVLRFTNPIDHLHDIVMIHFEDRIGTLKLAMHDDVIRASEKSIIERLLHQQLSFTLRNERKNKQLLDKVTENYEALKTANQLLKKEVAAKEVGYKKSISFFCNHYIQRLASQEQLSVSISEEAIGAIIAKNIPFDQIPGILERSLELCVNTSGLRQHITMSEYDIVFNGWSHSTSPAAFAPVKREEAPVNDRYAKTKEYLDRYEKAAQELMERGLDLTGSNLGAYCSPRITPAAISDNLKKHRSKIITLLYRYQEKWPVIRENYRPIRKLLDQPYQEPTFGKAI